MAKGKVLTTEDLPKRGPIEGPGIETAPKTDSAPKTGMVRLQQVIPGTVVYGGSTETTKGGRTRTNHKYRWTGLGVQTVPIAVAREIICKFRGRFRSLDPM